jgi:hypothetical protein
MSDITTAPTPVPPAAPTPTSPELTAIAADFETDMKLAMEIVKVFRAQGVSAAVAYVPKVLQAVQQDYTDAMAVMPAIKVGYKTSEFWALIASIVVPMIYSAVTKQSIPFSVSGVGVAAAAVYAAARTYLKAKAPMASSMKPVSPASYPSGTLASTLIQAK